MLECKLSCNTLKGRAIAQAVSHRLPIAAARVRAQVKSCGICGGQSGTGAGFLQVLRCSLTILIPPTAPQLSSSIIRGWYHRPISGRRTKWTHVSLTAHQETKNTLNHLWFCSSVFTFLWFRIKTSHDTLRYLSA
jgi:hypothetical protein